VNIKILVATHKQYWMPEDSVYMPIHVGREGKADIGYTGDHTGDNISSKNANYCELTGLYWAWEKLLSEYPVVVADKRKYYIESNRSHYNHAHHSDGLDAAEQIIAEKYPEYSAAFTKVCNRTWAHMFNMFVMRRDLFDQYCEWMFSILEEIEHRVDISNYDTYEARIYGFVSEILLDVWIEANNIDYKEQNVSFMEPQNWLKKGGLFLKRKFFK